MSPVHHSETAAPAERPWLSLVKVAVLLFFFLTGVRGLGAGFEGLGEGLLDYFFAATSNPFIGLMMGILATTLVQSSSVSTSLIVGLVAAPVNPLPAADAIPMVMGANIGTTVTNTVVSLGHISRPVEFRRAFAAATCHDFFNFIAVAIFLPVEMATGFLERSAGRLAGLLAGAEGARFPNPVKGATNALLEPLQGFLVAASPDPRLGSALLAALSAAVIFITLYLIVRTLRALTASRMEAYLTSALEVNPHLGLLVGLMVTVMVQSSSITTSILVPLAGAGLVGLHQIFPITLGANMGTTFTALVASLAASEPQARPALQVALAHLLFNAVGTLLVYPLPATRRIPVDAARWLGGVAVHSRRYALAYVLALFYGIPALLIFLSRIL